ncbi:hypothetical protein [Nocardioides caricicola]|uniref:Uncharacterized protein n=1 Tax=Nocardioides caricicola TaxID=634770 RepID=A0ABW0N498_9ACTN
MNDMAKERSALQRARLVRAEMIVALTQKILDVDDVLAEALKPANKALGTLTLNQLWRAAGKRSEWRDVRARMLGALGLECPDSKLTIVWLFDPKAGGRRYYAYRDALRPRTEPPSTRFPWSSRTSSAYD